MNTPQKIYREATTTKDGNILTFFFNPQSNLLVVDLVHKDEQAGNELVRMTLDEEKLLAHSQTWFFSFNQ